MFYEPVIKRVMQVQILLDGKILSTQLITAEMAGDDPTIEARRGALRAAIKDGSVKLDQILRVTFRLDDQIEQPYA